MERNEELEQALSKTLSDYSVSITWEKQAYKLNAFKGSKRISITWPYPLMEVFFDFVENDKKIMSESIEFYGNETQDEFCDYIIYIASRFFNFPSRLETVGRFPKRKELQVNQNNEWCSIFD